MIGGALVGIGLILNAVKKPWKRARSSLKTTIADVISDELAPINKRLDDICADVARIRYHEITNFVHDVQGGVEKSGDQWAYINRLVKEYLDSGKNGHIKINATFLKRKYEEWLKEKGKNDA